MSRSQFQRLAVVTIVVLLATIASQRIYASHSHHHYSELAFLPMERVVHIETRSDRSSCRVQAHLGDVMEARAETDRERTRVHREIAHEHRLLARDMAREQRSVEREARQLQIEAQALAREVQREVQQEMRNLRNELR